MKDFATFTPLPERVLAANTSHALKANGASRETPTILLSYYRIRTFIDLPVSPT